MAESSGGISTCFDLFTRILQQVCETTQWEYGEVWLPTADSPVLELSQIWYISTSVPNDRQLSWQQFRHCSEKFTLHLGEGLPGRVWASQTPEWIADVSAQSESYFLRNQIAKAFGARAGFGLPIHTKEVKAIFAFFQSQARKQDIRLIAETGAIVTQHVSNSGFSPR